MVGTGTTGTGTTALRQYYADHTLLLSREWVLKVLAIVGCLVTAALMVSGSECSGGAGGVGGAGGLLACAGVAAGVLAAAAARLPPRAPTAALITDISVSTVMGTLLLVISVVNTMLCDLNTTVDYLLLPFGVATSLLALGSAVATYRAATRRLDAALPSREPRAPPPTELEV